MLRGIASFGLSRIVRSDQSLTLSEDPPVTIAAVDTGSSAPLLDDAVAMTTGGRACSPWSGRGWSTDPDPLPDGDAVKLTVYVGPAAPGRRHAGLLRGVRPAARHHF